MKKRDAVRRIYWNITCENVSENLLEIYGLDSPISILLKWSQIYLKKLIFDKYELKKWNCKF